jgi:holo-ACP synthase
MPSSTSGASLEPTGRAAFPIASLSDVLAARDRRAAKQRTLLATYGSAVISLTLVSPGAVKDSPGRRLLMDWAEQALRAALQQACIAIRQHIRCDGITGPEAIWAAAAAPERLKRITVGLETAQPWGRLLDMDVLVAGAWQELTPLDRRALGFAPRPCLLCGEPAKECIGNRRHFQADAAFLAAELVKLTTGRP